MNDSRQLTVTVLIPCRNERHNIARILDELVNSDFPKSRMRILVLDGRSEDGTRDIVSAFASKYAFIESIDNPDRRKSEALNLGIGLSNSDVIVRIDTHASFPADYISKLVAGLDRYQADNIGGIRLTDQGKTSWSRAVAVLLSHPFAVGNAYYRTGSAAAREVDTVYCGCFRSAVFSDVGRFDVRLVRAQDREFNFRMKLAGKKIVLDPSVSCTYFPRLGFKQFVKWNYQGAFWLFFGDHLTTTPLISWRNWVPVAFLIWSVLSLAATAAHLALRPANLNAFTILSLSMLLLPLVVYLIAVCSVAISCGVKKRDPWLIPILMLMLPLTHYSYGIGAVTGYIRGSCIRLFSPAKALTQ